MPRAASLEILTSDTIAMSFRKIPTEYCEQMAASVGVRRAHVIQFRAKKAAELQSVLFQSKPVGKQLSFDPSR